MATLTYFTVEADLLTVTADTTDADADPQLVANEGKVTFVPLVNDGDVLLVKTLSPRAAMLQLTTPIEAVIDADGQLKYGAAVGVRLLANTAPLGLTGDLFYRVDFEKQMGIKSFVFAAETTDTVVNLVDVARAPGTTAVGVIHGSPIDDVTQTGDTIQFYVGGSPVGPPVTLPATGAPIDDVVATGSDIQFYSLGNPVGDPVTLPTGVVTVAGITDATTVGKASMLATDQAAGRAAIDAASTGSVSGKQASNASLTAISALSPANDDVMQYKSGAWMNRTIALLKSDLVINNVDNTRDVDKPVSAATTAALNGKVGTARQVATSGSLTGGGDLSVNRTVALVGDADAPGPLMHYGTDAGGVKGFYPDTGGGGGTAVISNGNGTFTYSGTAVTSNGNGTFTY